MLPYGRHALDEADVTAVLEALQRPLLTCGPLVGQFEAALGDYLGAAHVSACASGTAALHLAYAALGIGPGDEIITTPITFSATAAAAYYVGATVRIADVEPDSGLLDPAAVAQLITPRTRAIVPVHLAGLPADLDAIYELARCHGLLVIEDACHALGAVYRGHRIGSAARAADAVVFSFHPVKHITTLEGGAVAVRCPRVHQRIARLRQHGIERDAALLDAPPAGPWVYEVQELGWNYRLSDVACALGASQLGKLDRFLAARRELAAHYRRELARVFGATGGSGVEPPAERPDRASAHHLFAVAIDFERFGTTRARVMRWLAGAGIGTQVHYIPLLCHRLHASRCPGELARARPGADRYYARTLSLPLYPALTPPEATRVVEELARALGGSA
jgi:perosamine synthetase